MAGIAGDRAYDLKQVAVIFNGLPLSGAADGDFVTVTPAGQTYNSTVGAGGEVGLSATNNRMATIAFNIWQGSRANRTILEQAIARQRDAGYSPLTNIRISIKDLSTGEHLIADRCWIQQEPTRAFGADQQGREYTFATDNLVIVPL